MHNLYAKRVLFDTNTVMDAADETRPDSDEACRAIEFCNGGGDMGFVTAGSLKDAYYMFHKQYGEPWARKALLSLLDLLIILPLEGEATIIAAKSNEPDFEDALVRTAAELNEIDFVLTRDKKAFRNSSVRAISCSEYLRIAASEDKRLRASFFEDNTQEQN